jgi:hypothetical protein
MQAPEDTHMSLKHKITCFVVATLAVICLLWAVSSLGFEFPQLSSYQRHLDVIALVFVWALGPAIWFSWEWSIWKKETGLAIGQQYARDFWLGAGAIVLFLAAENLHTTSIPATGAVPVGSWAVDVVKAIAWPLIAGFACILFQKPIGDFLTGISARASKIGAFNVTIELATLPDAQRWSGPGLDDLKEEFPAAASDSSGGLFRSIAETTHADYVVVDLRDGDAWLTSRLFILTTLISRVRPIQRIVFLDGPAAAFLGECSPASVTRALARNYPWLEEAYISALVSVNNNAIVLRDRVSLVGQIAPNEASLVLTNFLTNVRQYGGVPLKGWTTLANYHEHADLISTESLVHLLGKSLNRIPVVRDPSEDGTTTARTLLRHDEDYVAVVDMAGSFLRLVDRRKACDQVVRRGLSPVS